MFLASRFAHYSLQIPVAKSLATNVLLLVSQLLLTTFIVTSNAQADNEIRIINITDYQENKQLLINSESQFNLPQEVVDAVHHEIPLSFKIQIQLTEKSRLLGFGYQRTRNYIEFHTKLYAYGMNRQYALFNTRNQNSQSFRSIDDALKTLATLEAFPIASLSELHPEQRYTLRMRISLDYWKLPAPMILQALFSSYWRLDSQWFETSLQTPSSWQ